MMMMMSTTINFSNGADARNTLCSTTMWLKVVMQIKKSSTISWMY